MKKVLIGIALFSVSSVTAKLEYNKKNHIFYHTGSSQDIDQGEYNAFVNEVLGETLLSSDFDPKNPEFMWLLIYGILKFDGSRTSHCIIQDIEHIALNKKLTAKLIAQLQDSSNHYDEEAN